MQPGRDFVRVFNRQPFYQIPSVLLLLFAGIGFKLLANANSFHLAIPATIIEGLGTVGLIMIVLEAGLDLKIEKSKIPLIRTSLVTALINLILSTAFIAAILNYWLDADIKNCIVYALPLSIMSSSIVLPSIHHLTAQKKEILVYEASFSDIAGIMLFNYFTAREIFTAKSVGLFGLNFAVAVIFSLVFSGLLFLLLIKTKLDIKFFLVFSLLVLMYAGGKLLHLPSLLIILVFGLMMNNWEKVPFPKKLKLFQPAQLDGIRESLHSITAETSF